jgi:hypothetical protein
VSELNMAGARIGRGRHRPADRRHHDLRHQRPHHDGAGPGRSGSVRPYP